MRSRVLALVLLVPSLAQAQPPPEYRERAPSHAPELIFGLTLLGGSYAGSILWARESEGDQGALYVPVLGPWLELFSLPDCGDRDVFCSHGNASRGVLIAAGFAQLVGVGFTLHGVLARRDDERRVVVAPVATAHGGGVSFAGRF